jgi:hypothetical protein
MFRGLLAEHGTLGARRDPLIRLPRNGAVFLLLRPGPIPVTVAAVALAG